MVLEKQFLLQMLNGLFNSRFAQFRSIPFRKFEVRFEEGSTVWIDEISESNAQQMGLWDDLAPDDSATEELAHASKTPIVINFLKNSGQTDSFILGQINEDVTPLSIIEEMTGLERIETKQWMSDDGEVLYLDEVIRPFWTSSAIPA